MLKKALLAAMTVVASFSLNAGTLVEMKTTAGNIEIELFNDKAPVSAKNFEEYAKSGFYAGTIFHRVIPGFMVQGGGFDSSMNEKATRAAIKNESANGLKNTRGTLAMARTNNPDSATSQFFINVVDNAFLNKSAMNAGYAVFGKVNKGMDVVDRIVNAPSGTVGMHQNVPKQVIKIISVEIKPAAQ